MPAGPTCRLVDEDVEAVVDAPVDAAPLVGVKTGGDRGAVWNEVGDNETGAVDIVPDLNAQIKTGLGPDVRDECSGWVFQK